MPVKLKTMSLLKPSSNNGGGSSKTTSLLLNNKKSPMKLKTNNAPSHLSPLCKTKLDKAAKPSVIATAASKKSLERTALSAKTTTTTKTTTQAFNKLDYQPNSTTTTTTSTPTQPPFSINNVSNNSKLSKKPNALNDASKVTNAPRTTYPLINPAAAKTAASVSLKSSTILKNTCAIPEYNLNNLSNHTKKVNFLIPECSKRLENDKLEENSSSTDDNNVDNQKTPQIVETHKEMPKYYKQHFALNKTGRQFATNAMMEASYSDKVLNKNIVFNGTYPIDMPLQARYENYDPEANCSMDNNSKYEAYVSSNDDYDDEDEDDDDDDDDDEDDYAEGDEDVDNDYMTRKDNLVVYEKHNQDIESENSHYHRHQRHKTLNAYGIIKAQSSSYVGAKTAQQKPPQVWSMQELINDPSIPLNYKKMCNEVEQSLQSFEKYIDSKTMAQNTEFTQTNSPKFLHKTTNVKTFNIDDPIDMKKNK